MSRDQGAGDPRDTPRNAGAEDYERHVENPPPDLVVEDEETRGGELDTTQAEGPVPQERRHR